MSKAAEKDSPMQIFRKGLQTIKKSHQLKKLIADMIVLSAIAYYSIWLWQGRLLDLNVDVAYFGLIHAGMIIGQILLLNMIIPLERFLRSKKGVVIFTGIGMGFGFFLFGISNNPIVVIIGILLSAGFGMSRPVLMRNYMQKFIPSEQRATTLSTASMLHKFVLMVLNPIIGFLAEWNIYIVLLGLAFLAILWSICTPVRESDLKD